MFINDLTKSIFVQILKIKTIEKLFVFYELFKHKTLTRMHSSRMRTTRTLPYRRGSP